MISFLLLIIGFLPAPSGFAEDDSPSRQSAAAPAEKPAPQLVQLERALTQKQEARANGILSPEQYQDFLTKFRAALDAAMTRVPPTPENKGLHAQIIARLGEKDRGQALASLSEALKENPKSPPLLRAKGQIFFEQKDYPAAAQSARQAWEYSNRSDIAALTLLKKSEGRASSAGASGVSPRAAPKPQVASAASMDDPSKPYKLAIKSSALPLDVPAPADEPKPGDLPPSSPYWPWPAGWGLAVLGAAWGVKKKLDDEKLTGPIAMTGLGVSLLGASMMFPPASPALATVGGPVLTVGAVSLGQAATGTLGSIMTTVGVKSGFENLISRAKAQKSSQQQSGSSPGQSPEYGTETSSDVRRPNARNSRLQRVIDELFKPSDQKPGGTSGAIREEFRTGKSVGNKFHLMKGQQRLTQLERILAEESLDSTDRATAEAIRDDLRAALKLYGKP